jgi:probable rRNA maturation factor
VSFYIEEECKIPFSFSYRELAEQVVEFCLEHEHFPYEAEVNLTLTDNKGIRAINQEYRQIDRPTDVLSFPMLSYERAGDFSFLEAECDNDFNPDTGEAILGDIIISVDKVLEQAEQFGHSPRREFAFLIVHSMLHLFGYDHIEEGDAAIMEPKQREILEAMHLSREEA